MSNTILELKNIEVHYGNNKVLKQINIKIQQGEIVSLIGANGAGKSTLLKSIVGLEPITNGEIFYQNEKIIDYKNNNKSLFQKNKNPLTYQIIKKGISLVPEGRGIFTQLTVLENLEMGAYLINDKKIMKNKIEEIYNMFPILKDRKNQKAGLLSGGEQQMLAIARSLINSPKLLLLDEPALGLAPIIIKNIFDTIIEINKKDKVTIFLIEQNAKMALKISNRAYVLETGNIVLEDTSANLLKNPKVQEAYLGG